MRIDKMEIKQLSSQTILPKDRLRKPVCKGRRHWMNIKATKREWYRAWVQAVTVSSLKKALSTAEQSVSELSPPKVTPSSQSILCKRKRKSWKRQCLLLLPDKWWYSKSKRIDVEKRKNAEVAEWHRAAIIWSSSSSLLRIIVFGYCSRQEDNWDGDIDGTAAVVAGKKKKKEELNKMKVNWRLNNANTHKRCQTRLLTGAHDDDAAHYCNSTLTLPLLSLHCLLAITEWPTNSKRLL